VVGPLRIYQDCFDISNLSDFLPSTLTQEIFVLKLESEVFNSAYFNDFGEITELILFF
jgi:hypothetical protein